MSLSGITRKSYEDDKYTNEQVIKFRELFKLSIGNSEEKAKFKLEAAKLEKKVELQLYKVYNKDAGAYIVEIKRKKEESEARKAEAERKIKEEQEKVAEIDGRLASLEITQKQVVTQYASTLASNLGVAMSGSSNQQTSSNATTKKVVVI